MSKHGITRHPPRWSGRRRTSWLVYSLTRVDPPRGRGTRSRCHVVQCSPAVAAPPLFQAAPLAVSPRVERPVGRAAGLQRDTWSTPHTTSPQLCTDLPRPAAGRCREWGRGCASIPGLGRTSDHPSVDLGWLSQPAPTRLEEVSVACV